MALFLVEWLNVPFNLFVSSALSSGVERPDVVGKVELDRRNFAYDGHFRHICNKKKLYSITKPSVVEWKMHENRTQQYIEKWSWITIEALHIMSHESALSSRIYIRPNFPIICDICIWHSRKRLKCRGSYRLFLREVNWQFACTTGGTTFYELFMPLAGSNFWCPSIFVWLFTSTTDNWTHSAALIDSLHCTTIFTRRKCIRTFDALMLSEISIYHWTTWVTLPLWFNVEGNTASTLYSCVCCVALIIL